VLRALLGHLHDTEAAAVPCAPTTVQHFFEGLLQHTIQCRICEYRSVRSEPFLELGLPVHPTTSQTLEDAFAAFFASHALTGSDKYACPQCMTYTEADHKIAVSRWPVLLIVHLKRFTSSPYGALGKVSQTICQCVCVCSVCGGVGVGVGVGINVYMYLWLCVSVAFVSASTLATFSCLCQIRTPMAIPHTWRDQHSGDTSPVYSLANIIAHTGASTAAGHYVGYARDLSLVWDDLIIPDAQTPQLPVESDLHPRVFSQAPLRQPVQVSSPLMRGPPSPVEADVGPASHQSPSSDQSSAVPAPTQVNAFSRLRRPNSAFLRQAVSAATATLGDELAPDGDAEDGDYDPRADLRPLSAKRTREAGAAPKGSAEGELAPTRSRSITTFFTRTVAPQPASPHSVRTTSTCESTCSTETQRDVNSVTDSASSNSTPTLLSCTASTLQMPTCSVSPPVEMQPSQTLAHIPSHGNDHAAWILTDDTLVCFSTPSAMAALLSPQPTPHASSVTTPYILLFKQLSSATAGATS
jgi:hypothetical protein